MNIFKKALNFAKANPELVLMGVGAVAPKVAKKLAPVVPVIVGAVRK
jgi:hypothetical protein